MTKILDYATAIKVVDLIEENLGYGSHTLFQINSITLRTSPVRTQTLGFGIEVNTLIVSHEPHEVKIINK